MSDAMVMTATESHQVETNLIAPTEGDFVERDCCGLTEKCTLQHKEMIHESSPSNPTSFEINVKPKRRRQQRLFDQYIVFIFVKKNSIAAINVDSRSGQGIRASGLSDNVQQSSRQQIEMDTTVMSDAMMMVAMESQPAATNLIAPMEVEFMECDCCRLTKECMLLYIERILEMYQGKWICGLCGEAVNDEILRKKKG
ncbi:unnamed protein product [Lactuca virosa]|uniref:Uncharacterized protein n=1 Tax=Lactuca virosa TaxID=75947 RepID=A0AAU9MV64_9ASTR|nr:unnamed protein product [Lactuca virosa]